MSVKLFVLGPPGCGKSSVCRYIALHIMRKHRNWLIRHVNDYKYLHESYQTYKDTGAETKLFEDDGHGGFIVCEPRLYDLALRDVEQRASRLSQQENSLLLIEFARSDYKHAFEQFSYEFVLNASFLFLDVDIVTCMKRVQTRANHPKNEDDYYVAEEIFNRYRQIDSWRYISNNLRADYGIDERQIKIMNNSGKMKGIKTEINQFVNFLLR